MLLHLSAVIGITTATIIPPGIYTRQPAGHFMACPSLRPSYNVANSTLIDPREFVEAQHAPISADVREQERLQSCWKYVEMNGQNESHQNGDGTGSQQGENDGRAREQ